jgi:hypothetical protein
VSSAIGRFGESPDKRVEWVAAVDTIFTIVANILKHPGDTKYYNINMMNPNFHQKYVSSVLQMLSVAALPSYCLYLQTVSSLNITGLGACRVPSISCGRWVLQRLKVDP